ncbi:MAG: Rho termination factor N-terminal domain-containing protein [Desulfobacterales bacterium]
MGKKKKETKEKPLEKMTSKDLREIAMKIPEITGVHGMNKEELISEIKKSRGIAEETKSKGSSAREIKEKIRKLKADRSAAEKADDREKSAILRKRIIRLKKKSRRAAA